MAKETGSTTQWIWLRHAPMTPSGRFCGQTDLAAQQISHQRYAQIAAHLPANAHVYASPLRRARETLAGLQRSGLSPVKCETNDLLKEQNFGDLEGTPYHGVTLPDALAGLAAWRPPGGESFCDVVKRVEAFLVQADMGGKDTAIVVAHAGVIRAALTIAAGNPPAQGIGIVIEPLSLTAISRCQGGSWKTLYTNKTIGEHHVAAV